MTEPNRTCGVSSSRHCWQPVMIPLPKSPPPEACGVTRRRILGAAAVGSALPFAPAKAKVPAQARPPHRATHAMELTVNGRTYPLDVDPRTTLLDTLREHLDLPGSKEGCDHGQC